MATKTEYEVDESVNGIVKDYATLQQMQKDGQLKPFSNYFTPDEDENLTQLKIKHLWENNNPTSEFSAQTIEIKEDLSNYEKLQIVYYNANYGNRYITTEIKPDENTYEMNAVHSTGNTVFVYYRGVKAGLNYIEFGDCWRGSNGGEAKTNNANIPVEIIGYYKQPAMIYTGKELFNEPVALNTIRTGQNDTVVEYKVWSDGKTWYRKWASGWKECGMEIQHSGSISGGGISSQYITLPIEFSNTDYTVEMTTLYGGSASARCVWSYEAPTTNQMYAVIVNFSSGSSTSPKCKIYCCGF